MKLKYLALAVTAVLTLNGCKVIDKIKDKVEGIVDEETDNAINDFSDNIDNDLQNAIDDLSGALSDGSLDRKILFSPSRRMLMTFSENTGMNFKGDQDPVQTEGFAYAISENILTVIPTNEGNTETIALALQQDNQYRATYSNNSAEDMYQAKSFPLSDLAGQILSYSYENEDCSKATLKFSDDGTTGEYDEKCISGGITTTTAPITGTVSVHPSLDDVIVMEYYIDGVFESGSWALYSGSIAEGGIFATLTKDSSDTAIDIGAEDFTNVPCHLPEEWHADMNGCMTLN